MRKVIKKFHTYVFASELGGIAHNTDEGEISADEAREGLLAELATFQMMLQKSALVCQAEARQVVEYEKEKERIGRHRTIGNYAWYLTLEVTFSQGTRRYPQGDCQVEGVA